jgi:integrase/predicted RNA-binding Zn-ribbon protein involved in translation (DUF1610 family)
MNSGSTELHREGMAGLAQGSEGVFGSAAASSGKFASDGASPLCPECGSKEVYRDGLRYLADCSSVQRWLCRDCGFRFSEKPLQETSRKSLNTSSALVSRRQICVSETKNLSTVTETKTVAGDRVLTPKRERKFAAKAHVSDEVRALVAVFRGWMEKEGYAKGSHYPNNLIRLVVLGADLHDPESVKVAIAKLDVRNGTKLQYVYAYDRLAEMLKINWEPPWYKQEETIPFVPEESELDQLIAACRSRRMATYLQCLKETWADPGEALQIERKDVSGNVITINHPVKGHLPRQIQVSNKLIAMLNALPRKSERYFPCTYGSLYSCYNRVRRRAAELQKNPRLLQIEFRSFRHWGGTMLAYYTNGNVLTVKKLLGHKRVENTMKYIGMIHFKNDEFEVATATTVEEAKQILSVGFDYITEKNGIMLFRRPKRFGNLEDKRRSSMINLK